MGKTLSLPSTIALPAVPSVTAEQPVRGGNVAIDDVIDARHDRAIVSHDGKSIEAASDVTVVVKRVLEESLSNSGLYISDSAPVMLAAEIRDWRTDITGKSSPRADATASIFLKVFDPANKMIYSGTYRGNSNLQKVSMTENDVRDVLGHALTEAVTQVTKDTQLLKLLSSF